MFNSHNKVHILLNLIPSIIQVQNFKIPKMKLFNSLFACLSVNATDYCEDGIYPHETLCNAFYECANGIRFADEFCPG